MENLDSNSGEVISGSKISIDEHEGYLKRSQLKAGDILFSIAGTLGRVGIIKSSILPANTNQALAIIRTKEGNVNYISTVLRGRAVTDFIHRNPTVGAQPNLSLEQVGDLKIPYPSLDEQKKIGDYFKRLDHLITLHQRKCDNLKIIKKSMLDNLFPKNGEKVPKWRFKGFNNDWEQRKFSKIFEEYSEKKHEELPPLTIIQGGGTVLREESNRNMQYDESSLSNYKMVKKDDFILHLRSFEGGLEKANTNGIISPAYHTFHGEHTDSIFYYSFFRSKYFIDVLLKPHVYGIRDGKSVDVEGMKSILVPFPTYDEQKLIGNFIERIDHLITLHQSEVERLKKAKQFFLDKMFI